MASKAQIIAENRHQPDIKAKPFWRGLSRDSSATSARLNVVLELGMVLANLGRKRVAILRKKTVEQPSDIDGLIYIPFDEHIDEIKIKLYRELQAAGYKPKLEV